MDELPKNKDIRRRLTAWVDGDREKKDRTLFVMEQRPRRSARSSEACEQQDRHFLRRFLERYPISAIVIDMLLVAALLLAVLDMPEFGQPGNPIHSEVAEHYLEHGGEETGAENAVTAMILSYRGFDTLGESCVLFLSMLCVMTLLLRDEPDTDQEDPRQMVREEVCRDVILERTAAVLTPFIFLFAAYVLLNGETSPGGGFSGGAILGSGLILFACVFGPDRIRTFMNRRTYTAVRTFGLLLYAGLYGAYILIGANGLPNHLGGMHLLLDLAVGLVVACTVYGFYAMFARG